MAASGRLSEPGNGARAERRVPRRAAAQPGHHAGRRPRAPLSAQERRPAAAGVLEDVLRREPDNLTAWAVLYSVSRDYDAATARRALAARRRLDPLSALGGADQRARQHDRRQADGRQLPVPVDRGVDEPHERARRHAPAAAARSRRSASRPASTTPATSSPSASRPDEPELGQPSRSRSSACRARSRRSRAPSATATRKPPAPEPWSGWSANACSPIRQYS